MVLQLNPFRIGLILLFVAFYTKPSYCQSLDLNTTISTIQLEETTPQEPVKMNAVLVADQEDSNKAYLVVKAQIHPNWHIYTYVPPGGYFLTSKLNLELPEGITAELVKKPKTQPYKADTKVFIYTGELIFLYELSSVSGFLGKAVMVSLDYQPCDPYICLPPNTISKELSL